MVFNKSDYCKPERAVLLRRHWRGEIKSIPNALRCNDSRVEDRIGGNVRTYRLALAATGEYTAVLGGTVMDGLSGIITTMNRVNGYAERANWAPYA